MKKTGLWIGRFQPYTKGHESGLNQIISSGIEKLIVGIGSAEEEWSAKNPMSYYEREKMISKYFSNKAIGIDFEIHPIPDFGNTKKWTNFILTNLPDFDTVYSANPYVEICFKDNGKNFSRLEVNSNSIKASYVRSLIANKNETWKNYVPNIVANYLEEIKLEERLENLIKKEEKSYSVELEKLGYNKLLGDGKVSVKFKIKTPYASKSAIEKVKEAGGEVTGLLKVENKDD